MSSPRPSKLSPSGAITSGWSITRADANRQRTGIGAGSSSPRRRASWRHWASTTSASVWVAAATSSLELGARAAARRRHSHATRLTTATPTARTRLRTGRDGIRLFRSSLDRLLDQHDGPAHQRGHGEREQQRQHDTASRSAAGLEHRTYSYRQARRTDGPTRRVGRRGGRDRNATQRSRRWRLACSPSRSEQSSMEHMLERPWSTSPPRISAATCPTILDRDLDAELEQLFADGGSPGPTSSPLPYGSVLSAVGRSSARPPPWAPAGPPPGCRTTP